MKYIRHIILLTTILFAGGIYLYWSAMIPSGILQITKLDQTYALFAVVLLYLALILGPLYKTFPSLPYPSLVLKTRRPLGVSAFLYAFLHTCFSFFGLLGGFPGIPFLDDRYLLAISMSFVALLILGLLAITSFDYFLVAMGKKWKLLQRFVYLAGLLIVMHALMLGSDFSNLSRTI